MTGQADQLTAEDLTALRDDQQLSWARVADALGLGSPGAARRAYSALVWPHTESVLLGRSAGAGGGGGPEPVDLTGWNKAYVEGAIAGRTVVVQRKSHTEEIPVARVVSVKGDTINFNDGDRNRTVKASAVIAMR
jgi:hypothetical protein